MEKMANKETEQGFRFFIDLIFSIWARKRCLWVLNAETASSGERRIYRALWAKSNNADFVSKSALLGGGAYRIRTGDLYNANVAR